MGFPKLFGTESVKYSAGATVFWSAVPILVFMLVVFKVLGKLLFACDSSIAQGAVKIVWLPRERFFKIIVHKNLRYSAMIFKFVFLLDSARRIAAKIADCVTRVFSQCFSTLATSPLFVYFLAGRRNRRVAQLRRIFT